MRSTWMAASAAFGALCLGLCAQTHAAPITFQGSTLGAFNGGTPAASATLDGLTYTNSSFDTTSSNDFAALGNEAGTGPGGSNVNNLGSLSLTGTAADYTGDTFAIQVTFTAPNITGGTHPANLTATLIGSVTTTNQGGVFIDFTSGAHAFTYDDSAQSGQSGTFVLSVNEVSLTAGSSNVPVTGQIIVTAIPEPSTALLGGAGVLALASRRRRAGR